MFFIFRFVNPATKMGILWELAEADLDPSAKACRWWISHFDGWPLKSGVAAIDFQGLTKKDDRTLKQKRVSFQTSLFVVRLCNEGFDASLQKKGDWKMMFHVFSSGHFQNSGCNSRNICVGHSQSFNFHQAPSGRFFWWPFLVRHSRPWF